MMIDGKERGQERMEAVKRLTHETEHARFRAITISKPRAAACKFEDIASALSELAAMMAEFPPVFSYARISVALSSGQREELINKWFTRRITNPRQSFDVSLKTVRCRCECGDADQYLKKTIRFATSSWSLSEKDRFHRELRDPKWSVFDLRWPVEPPAAPPSASTPSPPTSPRSGPAEPP